MTAVIDGDRIDYLNSVVARMYAVKAPDLRELGNLALQAILVRRTSQEVMGSDKYSAEERRKAEATLKKIDELENSIFRLYYLTSSTKMRNKTWRLSDHYYHTWSPK